MIIKKFQGRTKEEALESAKKELGEGIVEMNVKTVKGKGLFGLFAGSKVEVTVAKEEENERYGFAAQTAAAANQATEKAATSVDVAVGQGKIIPMKQPKESQLELADAPVLQEARAMGQTVAEVLAAFPPEAKKQPQAKPQSKAQIKEKAIAEELSENPLTEVPTGNVLEKKLDTLQTLLEKQLSQQEEKAQAEQAKEEEKQKAEEEQTRMNFLRLLYNKMIDNEVHEKYANEIIDEIEKNCKPDVTLDYMLSEIYQRMILKLGKAHVIEPAANGPKVIFFVGPTGVGKTTTIAKIASTFRIEQKKKVALLTADTYRIAAAEQLRTYANILEVPFRVVYSAQEITSAISDFSDYDYIIVDTTGHSPNNEAQRESMSELITSVETQAPKEVFLVLSASTKYRDLMKIADTYKELIDYKLIFTKLDETSTLGNIYNLKLYTGATLSYVTCGQNVPDDIEYFNPQATVKQLLGGKR